MNSVGRFFAIVAAVIMVLILPLSEIAKGQTEAMQGRVDTLSEIFTEEARSQGYITKEMYEEYLSNLGMLGDTYNVGLQLAHPVTGKESAERNNTEEIPDLSAEYASFKGGAEFQTKQLSTSTHIHTEDCYSGHRHNVHTHNASCLGSRVDVYVKVSYLKNGTWWNNPVYSNIPGLTLYVYCSDCKQLLYYVQYPYYYTPGTLTYANRNDFTPSGGNLVANNTLGIMVAGGTVNNHTATLDSARFASEGTKFNNLMIYLKNMGVFDDTNYYSISYEYYSNYYYRVQGMPWSYTGAYSSGSSFVNCPNHVHYICDKLEGSGDCAYVGNKSYGATLTKKYFSIMAGNYSMGYTTYQLKCNNCGRVLYTYNDSIDYISYCYGYDYSVVTVDSGGNIVTKTSTAWVNMYSYTSSGGNASPGWPFYERISSFVNNKSNTYSAMYHAFSQRLEINETVKKGPYQDPSTLWNNTYDYTWSKTTLPTLDNEGYSVIYPYIGCPYCGITSGCGLVQDDTLDCGNTVLSITATNPTQTVYKGDAIVTTATATMLDGSTKTVNCTASGYDSNSLGTQTVTLVYYGLVDNTKTTGTKSCTTTVTVKSRKTLTGITVTPAAQEIQRYTVPSFTVTASYSDGTSSQVLGFSTSGFNNTILGEQTVTLSYTEDGIKKTATAKVTVKRLTTTCPVCGTVYELDDNDVDQGCPTCAGTIVSISVSPDEVTVGKGEELPITVTATYRDGRTGILSGWLSNYNSNQLGLQDVKITYDTFATHVMVTVSMSKTCPICENIYSLNPDGSDPGCPICAAQVVSISALPENITIERNGTLLITVTATYKDGHTNVVDGWGTDFTADKTGEYDVPIYYKNAVDNIHVTVLDEGLITCPYCHTQYSYADNPNGCPICSKQIVGIEAQLRYGGNQVLYRSDLSLQVVLIYRDTHRKITYAGFEYSGYDSSILGIQTVMVTYAEFSTTLTVEVIDNPFLVTCPICGSEYYVNEDGSDPGCPYCNGNTGENAVFYFDCTYTTDILDMLYVDGTYYLTEGDYFTVTVTTIRDSVISKLANLFRSRKQEDLKKENSSFGGEVRII